jgi:hypothetical protein
MLLQSSRNHWTTFYLHGLVRWFHLQ